MLGILLENRLFDIQEYTCATKETKNVMVTLMILISLLTSRGEHRS